jgi:amino acid adenylation domain-containing protein/non-ribosomal peptide synthase protein (TIGR01720 family)
MNRSAGAPREAHNGKRRGGGVEVEGLYPLSPLQHGLLFHRLYAPESDEYIEQLSFRLKKGVDPDAFLEAWRVVVDRHPALRTSVVWEGLERPLQCVHRGLDFRAERLRWEAVEPDLEFARTEAFLQSERRRGIDLTLAPLMRITLIDLPNGERRFAWTFHHIMLDGWSLSLVLGEVLRAYKAISHRQAPDFESPPPYERFVAWLTRQSRPRAEAYWRDYLNGLGSLASFGLRGPTNGSASRLGEHAKEELRLASDLTAKLSAFARGLHVTLNTVVVGAWGLLLSRHARSADVMFGVTVSGRPSELLGIESMVGLFVNTLPIHVRVDSDRRVAEWLSEIQARQQEHQRHDWTPLVDIQRWAGRPAGEPFFESIVAFENYPIDEALLDGDGELEVADFKAFSRTNYPLSVVCSPGDELSVAISFNRAQFDAAAVRDLLARLEVVLRSLIADPGQVLGDVTLLTDAERRRLFAQPLGFVEEAARDACVHELFEAQARRTPDAVALECEGRRRTFAELDADADRLARRLRSWGVGPESLVGLCLERSAEMIVGLLAIWKAGAAYVPLDPDYPAARLTLVVEDARIRVVVTRDSLKELFSAEHVRLVRVDAIDAGSLDNGRDARPAMASSDNLAYVIYTSGSTGRPKGVMVEHRSVVNLWMGLKSRVYDGLDDGPRRSSLNAPLVFDASVQQIVSLLGGHCLHIVSDGARHDSDRLVRELREQPVDVLDCTPSHLELMVKAGLLDPRADARPRVILVGGEMLSDTVWRRLVESEGLRAFNVYGPTECTVDATVCSLSEAAGGASIGRPLPNTRAYILDHEQRPSAIGAVGELFLAGACLARGYMGDPRLTAERFTPDPFSSAAGARMYRTGDLARWEATDRLECLGRVDNQVKLRGRRIELGEIDSVLSTHESVAECATALREDAPGVKRLVSYVVARPGRVAAERELRSHIKAILPEYMVPSRIVDLDRIPLTINGKLDRTALPPPESARFIESEYVAPSTAVEVTLAEIWRHVLGLDRVGVHDNFFELGGDSILSIQIVSRAGQAGLELKVKQIFEKQTIAELARAVEAIAPAPRADEPIDHDAPLTPVQHWFFAQSLDDPHHFNQSLLLEVDRELSDVVIEEAIAVLLEHHEALRLRFTRASTDWRQQRARGSSASPVLERIDLSDLKEPARLETLTARAAAIQAGLSLADGRMARAALFELGRERGRRLLLTIHHLAVDGVSWRILLDDLHLACRQRSRGEAIQLPRVATSYTGWAKRLERHVRSGGVNDEAPYWLALARSPRSTLPVDFHRGPNSNASAHSVLKSLDESTTLDLLRKANRPYRTETNDLLLAALAQTLAEWTGQDEAWIELEGHGREEILDGVDVSQTVGWFTSIFPVRLSVNPSDEPRGILTSVKEQLRSIPRRGVGYGLLRFLSDDAAGAELARTASPGIVFNYLGQADRVLAPADSHFRVADEKIGPDQAPNDLRPHQLSVNCVVSSGRLRIEWGFSANSYRRETVERLANGYARELERLVSHCASADTRGATPSDFPLARLDQSSLDRLVAGAHDVEAVYPLTPLQEGLLFHWLNEPESEVYFEQLSFRVREPLDVEALDVAWKQVVASHAALRTAILWEGLERPLQRVDRDVDSRVERHDWRDAGVDEIPNRLFAFLHDERQRGFDLGRPPLMRLSTIDLPDGAQRLVIGFHHVILDGWSSSIVFGDLLRAYDAARGARARRIDASPPYEQYVAWLEQRDRSQDEAYWREYLRGLARPTPLGMRRRRGSAHGRSRLYAREHRFLTAEASESLQALVRRLRLTVNTLFQGVWAIVLGRYSGEDDVVFGVTVSGRPPELPGVERMVGLLINTAPLRVRIEPDRPVIEWLRDLQEQQSQRRDWSSLVEIRGWSELGPGQPLFESQMAFENHPLDAAISENSAWLAVDDVQYASRTNYPLSLVVNPGPPISYSLFYDAGQFEETTIRLTLERIEVALRGLTHEPDQLLRDVPILTGGELRRMADERVAPSPAADVLMCIHELFESQAAKSPESVAAVYQDRRLTYGELNARANRLARHLRALGVSADARVAIVADRGLEMIVGLLAILKAGGAYVPLDPAYPAARLIDALEDSSPKVVLTCAEGWRDVLGSLDGATPVIDLEVDAAMWAEQPAGNLGRDPEGATPRHPAYVVYTSGSTGRPKGVIVEHVNVARLFTAVRGSLDLNESDVWTLFHSFAFDFSVWEIWGALTHGARLVVVPRSTTHSPPEFRELLRKEQVTILSQTPSAFRQLLAVEREHGDGLRLRRVIFGGEALEAATLKPWFAGDDERRAHLINMYGITETTVHATYRLVELADVDRGDGNMIGGALADLAIYLLDDRGEPVPNGAPGEIHVGGAGVARGYLNRPGLTAERFLPDPFAVCPGARMYKSGDLGRRLPDGDIEYIGRNDFQVKIRGFRVELGEIESALSGHELVADCVAAAGERAPGDAWIVAYVVLKAPASGIEHALRAHLKLKLPDYMIPARVMVLNRIPLTINGKVDRRALPSPDFDSGPRYRDFVAPTSAAEQVLAALWRGILGIDRVGVNDDFFELGGQSLLATQLLSRLRTTFGVHVPMQHLFEAPTIAGQIERLTASGRSRDQIDAVARAWLRLNSMTEEERAKLLAARRSAK